MSLRRSTLLCAALFTATLLPTARATSVEPPSFESLVSQSDYVVRGVVKSITPEWRETIAGKPYIASKVEVEVREVIRGTPPTPLVLDVLGGKIGETEFRVTGTPRFGVGEENIFFLKAGAKFVSPLVGIMHGLYPVIRESQSGQIYAVRSNGMPLYSEQDVSLPLEKLSTVKTRNPAAKPLNASAFISKIRETSNRLPAVANAK